MGNPVGVPMGNPVGMGWEWELKFHSHGSPAVYTSTCGMISHDKLRSITVANEFTLTKVC